MAGESAYVMVRRIDGEISRILSDIDLHEHDAKVRDRVHALKRELTELCGEVRDYELAETLAEQQMLGRKARKRLIDIEEFLLALSQHDIFSPIEVVELSARIDIVRSELV